VLGKKEWADLREREQGDLSRGLRLDVNSPSTSQSSADRVQESHLLRQNEVAVNYGYTVADGGAKELRAVSAEIRGERVEGKLMGDQNNADVRRIHAQAMLADMAKALVMLRVHYGELSIHNKLRIVPPDDYTCDRMIAALAVLGVTFDKVVIDLSHTTRYQKQNPPIPEYFNKEIYAKISGGGADYVREVNLRSAESTVVKQFLQDLVGNAAVEGKKRPKEIDVVCQTRAKVEESVVTERAVLKARTFSSMARREEIGAAKMIKTDKRVYVGTRH
jgi:hypothetical protein